MTIEDAIKTIELAVAEVEWVYPIDYAAAGRLRGRMM